jgi:hypothetical protein
MKNFNLQIIKIQKKENPIIISQEILHDLKKLYDDFSPLSFGPLTVYNIFDNWKEIYFLYVDKYGYYNLIKKYKYIKESDVRKYIDIYIKPYITTIDNYFILPDSLRNRNYIKKL